MSSPLDTPRLRDWALGMARHVALLSKDPSTKVGAVILDPKRRLVSAGYNGFARGVPDDMRLLEDRAKKYKLILHAEKNAIMFATAPLDGCTMVVTHPCCSQCAALLVQAGFKHVVWPKPDTAFINRWGEDLELTRMQFDHAGVNVEEVP
jgi:dCMP deaminase